jgi:hypothetical protein
MRGWRASLVVGLIAGMSLLSGAAWADTKGCAAAKLRAAAKKASTKIGCHRRAILSGAPLDADCIAKAEERFLRAFAAAEARGGCATTSDADEVEAAVDQFVADLVAMLPVTTTTSTSTTSSSSPPSTINCGSGMSCSAGLSCGSNGEHCQLVPQCFCGGSFSCFCSAFTFTTCTMPTNCSTTSTVP